MQAEVAQERFRIRPRQAAAHPNQSNQNRSIMEVRQRAFQPTDGKRFLLGA